MPKLRAPIAALCLLLAPACDAGDEPEPLDDDAADEDDAPRGCAAESRADTYALGMTKVGERIEVSFVDARPAPPERGDNTWRIAIREAGVPRSELALEVEPYMPDHMHGTSIEAHAMPADVPGEYVLAPVNMFMPGLWQVTVYATLPDGSEDAVQFDFCVDP